MTDTSLDATETKTQADTAVKLQAFIAAYATTYAAQVGAADAASYADYHFKQSGDFHINVHTEAALAGRSAVRALESAISEGLFEEDAE